MAKSQDPGIDYDEYNTRPKKRLLTPIGERIEKLSYELIFIMIVGIILLGAAYYWKMPSAHSVQGAPVGFPQALYLSFANVTCYSDINAVGYGKLIAALQVVGGILLLALFIGKVASERQSAWLLLIYTSEQQRRLADFARDIENLDSNITAAADRSDLEELEYHSGRAFNYLASIKNYLNFQANQGRLADFGNDSALSNLYTSVQAIQHTGTRLCKYQDVKGKTRNALVQLIDRAESIGGVMARFHRKHPEIRAIVEKLVKNGRQFKAVEEQRNAGQWDDIRFLEKVNEKLLEKVLHAMPRRPWKKHIHKEIANALGRRPSLVHECISVLINRGHWPDLQQNTDV